MEQENEKFTKVISLDDIVDKVYNEIKFVPKDEKGKNIQQNFKRNKVISAKKEIIEMLKEKNQK